MRSLSIIAIVGLGLVAAALSTEARLRAGAPQQASGSGVNVRMQAPVDQAADFPLADLQATYQDMDVKKLLTMRLVEGGKYNVNIRRSLPSG